MAKQRRVSGKPRNQTTLRADPKIMEKLEERALEETMRLGVTVRFADLVRRGMLMVLAEPLPGRPARIAKCHLVPNAHGGTSCLECRSSWPSTFSQQDIMGGCSK